MAREQASHHLYRQGDNPVMTTTTCSCALGIGDPRCPQHGAEITARDLLDTLMDDAQALAKQRPGCPVGERRVHQIIDPTPIGIYSATKSLQVTAHYWPRQEQVVLFNPAWAEKLKLQVKAFGYVLYDFSRPRFAQVRDLTEDEALRVLMGEYPPELPEPPVDD